MIVSLTLISFLTEVDNGHPGRSSRMN
jgi:hypothetical protein